MDFIRKLEKKLYKYSIPRLYLVILITTVAGYFFRFLMPSLYDNLLLIPYMVVVRHQYWRLFTWIFTVPYDGGIFTILLLPITLYFYYYIGRNLEMVWGQFMYNLYLIGGALLTDIMVVLGGFYYYYWSPNSELNRAMFPTDVQYGGDPVYAGLSITRYMLISIFLAFTVIGGNHVMLLYFVIPIKMKWLGYIDLVLLAYYCITGGLFTRIIIICMTINYFIYWGINMSCEVPTIGDLKRRRKFSQAAKMSQRKYSKHEAKQELKRRSRRPGVEYNNDGTIKFPTGSSIIPPGYGNPDTISIHKCAVCGRTEKSDPNLEFRFCSKCNGNYEYCSEHLYTHQHVK